MNFSDLTPPVAEWHRPRLPTQQRSPWLQGEAPCGTEARRRSCGQVLILASYPIATSGFLGAREVSLRLFAAGASHATPAACPLASAAEGVAELTQHSRMDVGSRNSSTLQEGVRRHRPTRTLCFEHDVGYDKRTLAITAVTEASAIRNRQPGGT
jgi:hypothetical protein